MQIKTLVQIAQMKSVECHKVGMKQMEERVWFQEGNNITIHPPLCCAAPLVISSQHNPAAASSHASALFPGPTFYFRSCYVTSGEVGGEKNNRFCRREKEVLFCAKPWQAGWFLVPLFTAWCLWVMERPVGSDSTSWKSPRCSQHKQNQSPNGSSLDGCVCLPPSAAAAA